LRTTTGIVLKAVDYRDNDRMLTLLTKDYGLMSARAAGAKKPSGHMFAAAALLCCGDFEFYEKNGRFGVCGCEIRYRFFNLQNDYDAFAASCVISDAALKVAQEESADPKLFALVSQALYALDKGADPKSALCYFVQRLLYIEGVYPALSHCAVCGETKAVRFSAQHGGVCAMHAAPQDIPLTTDMADALVSMAGVLPRDMKNVALSAGAADRLLAALIGYLEGVVGKTIKAAKFVK
jgi:DNA repair protein RecO (recombination protein O)